MRRSVLVGLALSLVLSAASFGQNREAMLLFKDGTHVKGKVFQNKDFFVDKTGVSFIVPNGFLYFDDDVRKIYFSPAQVQEVMPLKTGERFKDSITLTRQPFANQAFKVLPGYIFQSASDWDENWERTLQVKTFTGKLAMQQRLVLLNSERMQVMSRDYQWNPAYFTKEYTPEEVRELLLSYARSQKESKDWKSTQRRIYLAKFFQQLDWAELAEKELNAIVAEFPDQKDSIKNMLDAARSVVAQHQAEAIDRAAKVGQHAFAQNRIEVFTGRNAQDLVSEKYQTTVFDWRAKYEMLNEKVTLAQKLLKELPELLSTPKRELWAAPIKLVKDELNVETIDRLERFLTFGQLYAQDVDEKKTPGQPLEEVLALAVSGWLMGPTGAEPHPAQALRLFRTRQFVLEFLRTDNAVARGQNLDSYLREKDNEANVEVVARLIKFLPPIAPHDKLEAEPQKLTIEAPESAAGSYLVQLPPEYNHQRTYPVLVVLHGASEKAEDTMARWKSHAASNGYILAAPLWATGLRASYSFTGREHGILLDTLRDLRRRFQVDSDRVFLFGWEQGADMAFDVGIGHPDQFAGVLPVCGSPKGFVQRCWTNAQYLPFYVVEGGWNATHPKEILGVFKDWIRSHYPSIYFEYKGRGSEWYGAELSWMMDWMRNRKRMHPNRTMGVYHTGGGEGEEFKTMRATDNRFYWLSTDHILDRCINDPANWSLISPAAKLQASVSIGNETNSKGEVKVWTQVNVRTFGVKQVTLWLAPTMIDFTRPIQIRLNGTQIGFTRMIPPSLGTMLEELYRSGDRQKLVYAKVEMKV